MGCVGLVFGLILAFANKKLAIEMNPLIHLVEDVLPKGQCGACGFAGCQAYAEAVVLMPDVPPNLCAPGKAAVAKRVSELTGKKAKEVEPRIAHVRCANPINAAKRKYVYTGIVDCVAASLLHLGPKDCQYGCIGYGTCEKACPFNAITLSEKGIPVINRKLCTGCGKCETVCPKKVIEMLPVSAKVSVNCNSRNKGAVARKQCPIPCLGCGICAKECPYQAIKIENNLAVVDSRICAEKCSDPVCFKKCPTGAITDINNLVKKK
jgi:Na+-translocating ferredoxin:NAD+ oxidoreductase RNF subunit RnfB